MAYYNGNYRMPVRQPVNRGCTPKVEPPTCEGTKSLAMAYVPWQEFEMLFDEGKALAVGTAFPSLYKPFMAGRKCR